MSETRTYYAISIFSSRTFWLNAVAFAVAALAMTEVTTLLSPRVMPMIGAFTAVANMWLRTQTVRPAVLIAPGATVAVQVAKVGPPDPPVLSD